MELDKIVDDFKKQRAFVVLARYHAQTGIEEELLVWIKLTNL